MFGGWKAHNESAGGTSGILLGGTYAFRTAPMTVGTIVVVYIQLGCIVPCICSFFYRILDGFS